MFDQLRLVLPKDSRPTELALSIWRAGVTPFSWAMQLGPDFLPEQSMAQLVTWSAHEAYERMVHDQHLANAINRADELLRAQGYHRNVDDIITDQLVEEVARAQ
jgi:hypothetical protein